MADVARGDQIRALRKQKERASDSGRLTQPMVAEAVGVTLRAYQDWEASTEERPKGIDWENAKKLAKFFNVDAEDVARREDDAEPSPWSAEIQELRAQLDRIATNQENLAALLDAISTQVAAIHERSVPKPATQRTGQGQRRRPAA